MDMLRNISAMFAGKNAKLPPTYKEIQNMSRQKSAKVVTIQSVRERVIGQLNKCKEQMP